MALSRRTLCDWVAAVADLVAPIVGEMQRTVLASPVIHSDDTPITVQDRGHPGGSRRGYLWVYGGVEGDLVYDYAEPQPRRAAPVSRGLPRLPAGGCLRGLR
ncbi:MAG: transposase [Candidatus Binatia bacterium]